VSAGARRGEALEPWSHVRFGHIGQGSFQSSGGMIFASMAACSASR